LLTPFDLDHAEYLGHAFDQLRIYAAPHPQVLMAIARTLRMLRGACVLSEGRAEIITALDRQLALTVAGCAPGMLPEDRARAQPADASYPEVACAARRRGGAPPARHTSTGWGGFGWNRRGHSRCRPQVPSSGHATAAAGRWTTPDQR